MAEESSSFAFMRVFHIMAEVYFQCRNMNIFQIEKNLEILKTSFQEESFIYDLLLAYDIPKATISLLKTGKHNLSKTEGQIILKKKLFFVVIKNGQDLYSTIDALNKEESTHRHDPRFLIVTDYQILLAIDTKTWEHKEMLLKASPDPKNKLQTFDKHFDFFLPWAGMEKSKYKSENPADIKAAYTLAKLYDAIREDNNISTNDEIHALNVFLSRILFCFFAEDTGIFPKDIFTYSIESHTQADGSDLHSYLEWLFEILDQSEETRWNISEYLKKFPYVNGGLFKDKFHIPVFKRKSRNILIESGRDLNWSEINPDIFGSMVQAVVHPDKRGGLGMHYTSVPNIMKVIQPLFLDELRSEYLQNIDNPKNLERLLVRMSKIRIFDPACGSGNFLIISYKELRKLEMDILNTLYQARIMTFPISHISLSQFYGIEIDDFAHEVAGLSLYIANHQMNLEFTGIFWVSEKLLPLRSSGNIVCANATRVDWEKICPKEEWYEVYILGNPPYQWARVQNEEQKEDMECVFRNMHWANNLDYIAIWFFKGVNYIKNFSGKLAFVSTNSVSQWSQVSLLWKSILSENIEIFFAYTSFKWSNNAKRNAGVTVVIVWLRNKSKEQRCIFGNNSKILTSHINGYLSNADDVYIQERRKPLSNLPEINYWSFALDDWEFTLSEIEKNIIIWSDSLAHKFIKPFIWAKELIQWDKRYCIWINTTELSEAMNIELIKNKIDKVRVWRSKSDRVWTKKLADTAWLFAEIRQPNIDYWAFPTVSSERREYAPILNLKSDSIASNQLYVIPTDEDWIFWIISSRMHMVWIRAVCGSLETRIRYSSSLWYNTFPFPNISSSQKKVITHNVYNILEERERYPEKTMAELYDPDKMPDGLREAHKLLDELIEQCYRATPFRSDEERLSYLFRLYEKMVAESESKS